MNTEEKKSDFIESLMYSREKCMMFHGLNVFSITLFILIGLYFDVMLAGTIELTFLYMIPTFILVLSFYLVASHDLSFIQKKRTQGTAIWRDHAEYYVSTFAKTIFFKRS